MQTFGKIERPFVAAFAVTAAILFLVSPTHTTTFTNTKTIRSVVAFTTISRGLHRSKLDGSNNSINFPATLPVTVTTTSTIQNFSSQHRDWNPMSSGLAAAAASDDATDGSKSTIRNIVIAGGGIMGTSVAYYLVEDHLKQSKEPVTVTLVDPTGTVGSCASGKAGGFLARDWRNGTPLEDLQQTGFELHEELSNVFEGIDYRRLTCAAVAVDESEESESSGGAGKRLPNKPPSKKLIDLEWVDPEVVLWDEEELGTPGVYPMGDEETIAQVHPRKLCEAMWNSIVNGNHPGIERAELIRGKIVCATTDPTKGGRVVTGVELDGGQVLPCDVLVVACGPWTYEANQWFVDKADKNTTPVLPQITAVKCHSILVPSATGQPNTQAVFFDSNGAIGAEGDLEVYPRPDGDSYVNGFANEEGICTEAPGKEAIEDDKIALLRDAMDFVENVQGNKITDEAPRDHTQQVCYWPETPSGFPIIGKLPQIQGAYVASKLLFSRLVE